MKKDEISFQIGTGKSFVQIKGSLINEQKATKQKKLISFKNFRMKMNFQNLLFEIALTSFMKLDISTSKESVRQNCDEDILI